MFLPLFQGIPTPQEVKDKWPCWCLLIALYVMLFVMKIITLDIISSILYFLMALMAWMIVRNDFRDGNDLFMMYAVLCIMNFVFDLVPLIIGLERGRTTVTQAQSGETLGNGVQQIDTTETFKTTPFFDSHQSFRYNLQSLTFIISPCVNAFGAYLSCKAVNALQTSLDEFGGGFDEEAAPFFQPQPRFRPARGGGGVYRQGDRRGGGGGGPYQGGSGGGGSQRFDAFQGSGHRLGSS